MTEVLIVGMAPIEPQRLTPFSVAPVQATAGPILRQLSEGRQH